jgi:flavin-dependent dehydrogenase
MNRWQEVDVAIIGAGPAGLTAALVLLKLGYGVAVSERRGFPRPNVGESLTPGVIGILNYLDAGHILSRVPHATALQAVRLWQSRQRFEDTIHSPHIIVDRGSFDLELLRVTQARGARCFQPATGSSVRGKADEAWELTIDGEKARHRVRARYLLDARGRTAVRARLSCAPALLALWAECPRSTLSPEARTEATPRGWLWGSPLADGRYRIMGFCDPASVRKGRPALSKWFGSWLQEARLFRAASSAVSAQRLNVCAATPYVAANAWRRHHAKLGEAAFAIDPLSSSGVESAMRFSLQAVTAVHTVLSDAADEELARDFFRSHLREAVDRHAKWIAEAYESAWPSASEPFWRARVPQTVSLSARELPPDGIRTAGPHDTTRTLQDSNVRGGLRALLDRPVHAARALRFVSLPCALEGRVRMHAAAHHPELPRPVAFLDGMALQPLIASVTSAASVKQWLELCFEEAHRLRALRIVMWLLQHGLIVGEAVTEQVRFPPHHGYTAHGGEAPEPARKHAR